MFAFLIILGFVFTQPPSNLNDVIVWTFNSNIYTEELANDAVYVNPQYCKRAWFKYGAIAYDYFPDPTYQLWTLPPILNDSGVWFEGGVQVSELWSTKGWPCDNPYDPDHLPPYKIPDPVFYDFATRDANDSLYWQSNPWEPITFVSIANENLQGFVLYWAFEQIDANVNAIEFDVITGGGHRFDPNGEPGNNPNIGYDIYHLGTANLANKLSVVCDHGMIDPIDWFMPIPSASSELDSAKYAFDDDIGTYWMSPISDSHWIEIDFGRLKTVQQIYLYLHSGHILEDFSIKYLNDISGWTDFTPPINIAGNSECALSFLVESAPTSKIRLFSSDNEIYLPELQIFGQGFRQYLLKRYCVDSGWTATDSRWETEKLVEFGDSNQCPDSTMNTFNYQKYLEYHDWTGNPFGESLTLSNLFDPYNPLFFDWFPCAYWGLLTRYFFEDSVMVDSATTLYMKSYLYQVLSSFWELISDSVKNYGANQGKEIYVTYNGSCSKLPFYCDYLMRGLAMGRLFPAYLAPSPTDSMKLHLDGSCAQINCWRLVRKSGLSVHQNNPPIVVFLDFGFGDFPFAHLGGIDESADEHAEYLRTYIWEIYAAGLRFCFPIRESTLDAWKDTTSQGTRLVDVMKEMTNYLNKYKEIYQYTTINSKESAVKVNGIVPSNGEWNFGRGTPVNESKVTIAYMDTEDGNISYLHIINHNWDSLAYRMIAQDSVPVEIPVKDSCIMVRVISPDFAGEDTLPFTYQDSVVSCTIPNLAYYDVLILDLFSTDVEENAPIRTTLFYQNHPNPFTKATTIRYSIGHPCLTQLKIYNLAGQMVKMLVNKRQKVGSYSVVWDSKDNNNKLISSGLYFIKLIADDFQQTKKLLLLR